MSRHLSLPVFLLAVLGGGLLIGSVFAPGDWYAGLAKPPFNPPNWVFAPVWTVLYLMIAIVGWRVFERRALMRLWLVQLVLNFSWTPIFFGARQVAPALAVIVLLLAVILAFIRHGWQRDRTAALLFVPYAAWVAFAAVLNASIFVLN